VQRQNASVFNEEAVVIQAAFFWKLPQKAIPLIRVSSKGKRK